MSWLGRRVRIATGRERWVSIPVLVFPIAFLTVCCSCYTACSLANGALIGAALAPGWLSGIATTGPVVPGETEGADQNVTSGPEPTSTPTRTATSISTATRAAPSGTVTPRATGTSAVSPLPVGDDQAEPVETEPTVTNTPEISPIDTSEPTASILPTHTATATSTATPSQEPTATTSASPLTPTQTFAGSHVHIVAVDKVAEWVNLRNDGSEVQELAGWLLVSEKGGETCPLGGTLRAGATVRVWALAHDADQDGYHCGFGVPIWDDDEPDAAVLYDSNGQRKDRFP